MKTTILALVCFAASACAAQQSITFPLLGKPGEVHGDLYGKGTKAVVLAHGGRFDEKSWKTQAEAFENTGFAVLALRFRGDTRNPDDSPSAEGSDEDNTADVLAAVAYLHRTGAKRVSAVGASLGGDAVGDADALSPPGNIERVVFLGSSGGDAPEKLTGRKLFIVAREDKSSDGLRLPDISEHYAKAQQPKKLVVLNGAAHAQFLFSTDQGPRLMDEILRFLTEP